MVLSRFVVFSVLGFATLPAAIAQSSIQCERRPDGVYEAALVWQNTLGARRANALCQSHADAVAKNQVAAPVAAARPHQVHKQVPIQQSIAPNEQIVASGLRAAPPNGDFVQFSDSRPTSASASAGSEFQRMW